MSQSVTLNSSSYTIPDVGENDWGQNVTDFLVAIPGAVLQKSGGTFTLTAEVDFGVTYGLKSAYYKSRAANPASAGAIRLGVADVVSWRNNANGGDLNLGVDAADALVYGANKVLTVAGGFTVVDNLAFANQKGVRFMELTANGTNYIEIVAPDAVTASVTLKLPDGAGSAGQVLSTDGAGVLSWIAAAGGGTINTGTQGRLAVYSSTGTTLDDVVTMTNTVTVAIAAHGQGSVYTIPDSGSATADFVMNAGAQTIAGSKTFTGNMIISHSSTGAFQVSNASTLIVDSTNALVSIGTTTRTYPLYISKSSAGANVTLALENSESANAASHARLYIVTGGASGGDPFETFYNGITNWSVGLDNSDSDSLCWTGAATLNGTNLMKLTTAGALSIAAGLTVTTGGAVISAGALTISATTNQIVLGTTNTLTITSPAPASSATYTIPDVGTTGSFILTTGAQTITGAKTFASSTLLLQEVSSTDVVTIAVASLAASRIYTVPDAGAAASFVMTEGAQVINGTKTFGSGGTGTTNAIAIIDGGSGSDTGPQLRFSRNSVLKGTIGTYSGIFGGASDNLTVYSPSASVIVNCGGTDVATFASTGASIKGTTTNDSAAAGFVGQLINAQVARSGPVATVASTAKTVTSISLTAGDWDIRGAIGWRTQGTTTTFSAAINTTTNALPTGDTFANFGAGLGLVQVADQNVSSAEDFTMTLPVSRVSLSGTTTIYLVQQSDFANNVYGYIEARRVR